jgi:hypothetical protein
VYLVKNGQPCGVIGIDTLSPRPVSFAAYELQRYIQQVTDGFMPVCSEPRNDVILRVGIDTRLSDEEFEIVSKEDKVEVLGGSGLGALYGAYHLLKEHCGIIFAGFGPEGEYVPHLASIEIPEGTDRRKPLLWYRGNYFILIGEAGIDEMPSWRDRVILTIDWMAKNGMNYIVNWPAEKGGIVRKRSFTWKSDTEFECHVHDTPNWCTNEWLKQNILPEIQKRGMKVEVGAHNMSLFLPPAVYFEKHPEYYAMRDGKRSPKRVQLMICTSNHEAVEEYTKNVLRFIEENPSIDMLSLVQEDDLGMCECEECRKLDDSRFEGPGRKIGTTFMNGRTWTYSEHQNKIRRHLRMMNYVAGKIKERYPKLKIGIEFYLDMAWSPADIKLEDNMYPYLGLYIRCGAHRYDDRSCEINSQFYELLREWSKIAEGRMFLVEYYNAKSSYRSLPYPIARRIAEDWKLLSLLGFGGQKNNQATIAATEMYALNNYTFARRGWDMDEPFERILDDFLKGQFGSKAAKIKPIFQQWMDRMDQFGKEGQCYNADGDEYFVPADHEPPQKRHGNCYHPDGELFLAVYDSKMVRDAIAIVDSVLTEDCTFRERVQLERYRTSLEFVERFREANDAIRLARREKKVSCDRAAYDKVMEFLTWEQQHIDTGYFAWCNDSYQWKNGIRGVL